MGAFNFIARDFRQMERDAEMGVMEDTCEPGYKQVLTARRRRRGTNKRNENPVTPEVKSPHSGRASLADSSTETIPDFSGRTTQAHEKPSAFEQPSPDNLELQPVMTIRSEVPEVMVPPQPSRIEAFFKRHHASFLWEFIKNFGRPPSFTLLIALFCTFIPPIRRLFYVGDDGIKSWGASSIPTAPEGLPILGFIMDFTSFSGNAQVPLGLMMLGATAGKLKIKTMPKGFWKSALLMCICKLVVLPIIAIAWTGKMKDLGWIETDNKIAQLVMILNSGVPTPTMVIYITAIFQPKEVEKSLQMDCVAIYLIMQYAFLCVTMTVLLSYTLVSVIKL